MRKLRQKKNKNDPYDVFFNANQAEEFLFYFFLNWTVFLAKMNLRPS